MEMIRQSLTMSEAEVREFKRREPRTYSLAGSDSREARRRRAAMERKRAKEKA